MLAISTPARSGPLACPMSPIVPCIPIPAPSVLNSELTATKAEDDEVTTASPYPNPADRNSRTEKTDTCGMQTNVAAQINNPSMINGCRPTRSDTRPMIGFEKNDVRACTVNNSPTSPGFNPTERPSTGKRASELHSQSSWPHQWSL